MEVESEILETKFECPSNDPMNFLVDRLAHLSSVLPPGIVWHNSTFLVLQSEAVLLD
jgi:hypothetical protein